MHRAFAIVAACVLTGLVPAVAVAQNQTFYVADDFDAPASGSYSGFYTVDPSNNIVAAVINVTAGNSSDNPTPAQSYGFSGYDSGESFAVINGNFYGGLLTISPSKSSPAAVSFGEGFCGSPECDTLQSNIRVANGGLVALVVVPTVTSLSPASGVADEGGTVTITGTGFWGASAVTFGGVAATSFTVVDGSTITAVVPPLSPGVKEVVITALGGSNSTVPTTNDFTVTPAPIPTLSEWAMILFGCLLAGAAALRIQRRQAAV